ncbi:metal-dependent hydrolase [Natronosalvus halobius]|uniref:metal-dependent hydrolase n=1 Tax=Natronosalvus halobius TaxID=2953746 RepID=UPI00209EBEB0|nr:metal-dependent hydrolase [Natronosalvus halobius]USZ71081.1 metal-dependent hydrolase [Natronosalvus halobius]
MFVGHALFAFAIAALVAEWRGWESRRALTIGVVAGLFAAVPDVDVAYALVGLAEWSLGDGALGASTAFWDASRTVHRSATHSLVVGVVAASAFGLLSIRRTRTHPSSSSSSGSGSGSSTAWTRLARTIATGLLAALVVVAFAASGPVAAFVMALFAITGAVVALGTARATTFSPATVALAALWGLCSHPWGDLFTGEPPAWLFPFATPALESRVLLHPDPTLNLLGAFAIELGVIWLALLTYAHLADRDLLAALDRRAAAGAAYGAVALVSTPPTLDMSYHFVFSILGAGLLCGVVREGTVPGIHGVIPRRWRTSSGVFDIVLTALTGVTIALLAYVAVYVLAGSL